MIIQLTAILLSVDLVTQAPGSDLETGRAELTDGLQFVEEVPDFSQLFLVLPYFGGKEAKDAGRIRVRCVSTLRADYRSPIVYREPYDTLRKLD